MCRHSKRYISVDVRALENEKRKLTDNSLRFHFHLKMKRKGKRPILLYVFLSRVTWLSFSSFRRIYNKQRIILSMQANCHPHWRGKSSSRGNSSYIFLFLLNGPRRHRWNLSWLLLSNLIFIKVHRCVNLLDALCCRPI